MCIVQDQKLLHCSIGHSASGFRIWNNLVVLKTCFVAFEVKFCVLGWCKYWIHFLLHNSRLVDDFDFSFSLLHDFFKDFHQLWLSVKIHL